MKLGDSFRKSLGFKDFKPLDLKKSVSKSEDLTTSGNVPTNPTSKTAAFKDLMLYSMLTEKHGANAIKDLNLAQVAGQKEGVVKQQEKQ